MSDNKDQAFKYIEQVGEKYSELSGFVQYQIKQMSSQKNNNQRLNYNIKSFIEQNDFILYENFHINDSNLIFLLEFYKSSGFGDLLIGYKITEIIRLQFKNSKIYVMSNTPDKVRNYGKAYLQYIDEIYDINDINDNNDSPINKLKNDNPNAKVLAITLALSSYFDLELLKKNQIKHIFIDEYHGWRASNQLNGLQKKEYDIYMIPGFGINPDCNLISCGININHDDHNINTNNNKKYYFGYVSSSCNPLSDCVQYILVYVMSIIKMKKIGVNFILVCKNLSPESLKSVLENNCSSRFSISSNQLIDQYGNTIELCDYLPHDQMLSKIKLSQSPVLITGDQSLAEAISFNKLFIYQPHGWKKQLINNYIDYCNYRFKNKTNYLKFLQLATKNLHDNQFIKPNYDQITDELTQLLIKGNIINQASVICDSIKRNFNIKPNIVAMIKRYAISDQLIDQSVTKIFNEIIHKKNNKRKIAKTYSLLSKSVEYKINHPLRKKRRLVY